MGMPDFFFFETANSGTFLKFRVKSSSTYLLFCKEVCNRAVTNQPPQARAGRMISQVTALLQTSLLFCLSLKGYYSDTRDCPRFRSKNAQIQHKQKIKDYS